MNQTELDRALSRVTGEDLLVIAGREFVPQRSGPFDCELPEPRQHDEDTQDMILKFPSPSPRKPAA